MRRVLIHYYNKHNLGDDLFIKIVTDRYMDKFSLISMNSSLMLSMINNLYVYSNPLVLFVVKLIERVVGIRNIALSYLSKRCDLYVYVGGSVFIENNDLLKWKKEADFYKHLTLPYYILGSNIGPYKTNEFLGIVRDIVAGAQDVCLRDTASHELVKDLPNVRVATDIAFTLDTSLYDTKSDKLAVFSVINGDKRFSPEITQKYEQEIVNLSRKLVGHGYKVVLMSFCKFEGDEDAIRRIIANGGEGFKDMVSVHNYDGYLEESLALLAKSEIIVASRFHGAILGLLFSKKVLPMAYSAKTTNILNDMHFRGPVIDINKIDDFDGSSFDFDTLEVSDVSDQVVLAEKQFQELDKVLTKR